MAARLICEHCDNRTLSQHKEENKTGELACLYCPVEEMPAIGLFQGKPCCINCKINQRSQTISPSGSIRSERVDLVSVKTSIQIEKKAAYVGRSCEDLAGAFRSHNPIAGAKPVSNSTLKYHDQGSFSQVNTEFLKANAFLLRYVSKSCTLPAPLYDSSVDGFSARVFHSKCDESKAGIIIIVSLGSGYEIAAFSWKGNRKWCVENSDVQLGGAKITDGQFEFVSFQDQFIINEAEGIRFSRMSDLYLNLDNIHMSVCNFDRKLASNPRWTSWIHDITVYKLQI